MIHLICCSFPDYVSPKDTNNEKGVVLHHDQHSVTMAAELSDQLPIIVNELDNSTLDTAAVAAVKVTEGPLSPPVTQMSSSRVQPPWSLPAFSPEDTCMPSEDQLTNFSSQSSATATGAEVDDSGFLSVLNGDDSVMLSGDHYASSSSSSSLNCVIKTECATSSQTIAPMVCHSRPVLETIALAALQNSEPLSISSQCMSFTTSVSNQSNEMVGSQSKSFDSICSETDQQQYETSETEEGYGAGSSFSITSGPSTPNHGSEASSRMAATLNTAAGFPPAGHYNGTKNFYDASENVNLVKELQKVTFIY